jgi:PAS domain S-box-containing protein
MAESSGGSKKKSDFSPDSTARPGAGELRGRAEENASAQGWRDVDSQSQEETRRMLHELRVHQIELQMQNEQLRATQDELEASRARYIDLYDLAPVGYCTLSEEGIILEANLTLATLLGVARNALVMRTLGLFIFEGDQDAYYRHRRHLLVVDPAGWEQAGQPEACELRMVKEDGGLFWALLESSAVQGDNDTRVLRVAISDITRRKRAEEEREKLQAQLSQTQKMETIGRLAGGIAHDFNNLLTVINGQSELTLEELAVDDPVREQIEEIHSAGKRAAALTRQLIAFSRKQILQPRVLDLNRVVGGMRSMLERLVGETVEVRVDVSGDSATVRADPHQLEQVIMNLAVNAREAMPNGGRLQIETAAVEGEESSAGLNREAPARPYVMLSVSDSGVGMDEATRQRIFEPFFTTKGHGTGMGLSMVEGIVAQSGGRIEVVSEPGRGTTFRIYLPAAAADASQAVESAPVPALQGRGTLLVVEDQAEVRNYATAVLKKYGHRVIQAANGDEALTIFEQEGRRIDMVLTDMVMPGKSGRELIAELRKIRPRIKALFMTGYTDDIAMQKGSLEEGTEVLHKPFSPEELARRVHELLEVPGDGVAGAGGGG